MVRNMPTFFAQQIVGDGVVRDNLKFALQIANIFIMTSGSKITSPNNRLSMAPSGTHDDEKQPRQHAKTNESGSFRRRVCVNEKMMMMVQTIGALVDSVQGLPIASLLLRLLSCVCVCVSKTSYLPLSKSSFVTARAQRTDR
jgi:hypothetical protein